MIVLSSLPQCNVQMENPVEEADFLCQLKTDAYNGKSCYPSLPKPTLVKDIPAAGYLFMPLIYSAMDFYFVKCASHLIGFCSSEIFSIS